MIFGIQLLGILFGVIMIYLTYTSYMRGKFSKEALILWSLVWLGGIFVFSVPHVFYGIMDALRITRTADFFVAGALIFLTTMIFHMYVKVKYVEDKMEQLVRNMAVEKQHIQTTTSKQTTPSKKKNEKKE